MTLERTPSQIAAGGGGGGTVQEVSVAGPTAIAADLVLAHSAAATIGLTTPAAPATGAAFTVIDIDRVCASAPITVTGSGGQLINGRSTLVLDEDGLGARFLFDGTNWTVELWKPNVSIRNLEVLEDFLLVSTAGDGSRTPFEYDTSGGGNIRQRPAETGHQGILRLNPDSVRATVIGYASEAGADGISFTDGRSFVDVWLRANQLPTAAQDFVLVVGFGQRGQDLSPDPGLYFVFNRGLSTTNWYAAARDGGSTETDTGVALTTDWVRLRIVVEADGQTAYFFIDGVLTNTFTVGGGDAIPAGTRSILVGMFRQAGGDDRDTDLDRIHYQKVLP